IVIMILIIRVDRFVMSLLLGAVDGHGGFLPRFTRLATQATRGRMPMRIKQHQRGQDKQNKTIGQPSSIVPKAAYELQPLGQLTKCVKRKMSPRAPSGKVNVAIPAHFADSLIEVV